MPFTFKLSKRLALMKARVLVVAAAAAVGCDVDRSLSGPSAPRFATSTTTQAAPPDSISVESTYGGYSASVIHDGVIDPTGGTATTWASADEGPTAAHWITVSFATPTTISSAAIDWAYNTAQGRFMTSQDVDVQYWDGTAYQTAASLLYSGADVANSSVTFPSVTTTALRFYQPANMGPPAYPAIQWLTEIDYRESAPAADTTPPSVPMGPTATAASSSQINLVWTASTDSVGVTGYRIFRGGVQIATSTATSYSDIGLSVSTAYTYNVSAHDAAGNNSAPSVSASVTTRAASAPGVSVDSTYGGYSTSVIHDGVINAAGGTATTWASADEGPTTPHWIAVSFASPTAVGYAAVYWAHNNAQGRFMTSQRVDVQYWDG